MADQEGIHDFIVEGNGHKMRVIIPKSDDRSYDDYLIQAETEKTQNELRAKPPATSPKPGSREALGELLKERQEFNKRRARGSRKYW